MRGTDSTGNVNYGNDVFKSSQTRSGEDNFGLTAGKEWKGFYGNFNAAYELRPNLFIEAGALYTKGNFDNGIISAANSVTMYGGLRLNITRKEYDGF